MSEKNPIKLINAAKTFNVGMNSLAEFLTKKGFPVDAKPITKLDDQMYNILLAEFGDDKMRKEAADGLELGNKNKNVSFELRKGEILGLESFFYFPGLAKNHSFLASFNYQKGTGVNQYATEIATVYGYNNILAKNKLQNTLLFNYRFPLAYPDWEIGSLAYVRNFRGGLFCHYENIGINTNFNQLC